MVREAVGLQARLAGLLGKPAQLGQHLLAVRHAKLDNRLQRLQRGGLVVDLALLLDNEAVNVVGLLRKGLFNRLKLLLPRQLVLLRR